MPSDTPNPTAPDPWAQVYAVECEIALCAFTSAGDPKRIQDMMILATWAGRLQTAIKDAGWERAA